MHGIRVHRVQNIDRAGQLLLLKPAAHVQVGKSKLLQIAQPHKHLRHGKLKKTQLMKQHTVDCSLKPIQRSDVKHSVGKVNAHSNLAGTKHLANWDVLHLYSSNSNGWSAAAARVCRILIEADGSSLNKKWFEFALWTGQSLVTEYTWRSIEKLNLTFSSWPPNWRKMLRDCENYCIIATK